jgi:hypothetical protein
VSTAQDFERHKNIDDAVIYDYNANTKLGDDVFGTIVADFSDTTGGRMRNSHGGPVCMEYTDGTLVAFYTNTSGHNIDGWSEYALSRDGGRTWDKYHPFPFSKNAYEKDPKCPVWVEEGLVTENGTVVLILTHFQKGESDKRIKNSITYSKDLGRSWIDPRPFSDKVIGYPAAVASKRDVNYILFDGQGNPPLHELYVSTDSGETWTKRSTLPLQENAWYGAMCIMDDGRILAGAYVTDDENHLYYCISQDGGFTWSDQERTYLDKKIRDPELACLDGKYYLHGRSGHKGDGLGRFVLYQSNDGILWKKGVIVSSDTRKLDGYSHNCIINKFNKNVSLELMVLYSIVYSGRCTSEYVFFIKPD